MSEKVIERKLQEQQLEKKKLALETAKRKKEDEIKKYIEQRKNSQLVQGEITKLGDLVQVPVTNLNLLETVNAWAEKDYTPIVFVPIPMGSYNFMIFKKDKKTAK